MLPIRRLQIFEVVSTIEIKLFEVFAEDDDRVTNEKVGEVCSEEVIHTAVEETLFEGVVNDEIGIMVFFSKSWVLRDVG